MGIKRWGRTGGQVSGTLKLGSWNAKCGKYEYQTSIHGLFRIQGPLSSVLRSLNLPRINAQIIAIVAEFLY